MVKIDYVPKRKDDFLKKDDEFVKFKDEIGEVLEKYAHMSVNNKKNIHYNVLAVGSHPDDVELGCGGVLAKHVERGDEVTVLILTKGSNGMHHPKMNECHNSMKLLGIKNVYYGDYLDGYVKDNHEVVNFIESIIKKHNVNRIYTHHPHDRHQDHRNCSLATSSAARKIKEILLFQGPSTNVIFDPHYFVELSERHYLIKINAIKCYNTQIEKNIVNLDWIDGLAKMHGWRCNTRYAEAFALNHIVKGGEEDV